MHFPGVYKVEVESALLGTPREMSKKGGVGCNLVGILFLESETLLACIKPLETRRFLSWCIIRSCCTLRQFSRESGIWNLLTARASAVAISLYRERSVLQYRKSLFFVGKTALDVVALRLWWEKKEFESIITPHGRGECVLYEGKRLSDGGEKTRGKGGKVTGKLDGMERRKMAREKRVFGGGSP